MRPPLTTVKSLDPNAVSTGHGSALAAGFLGWTLDAFDFFLVSISLTAIAAEFHQSTEAIVLSITLTLAFRPLGAFIFGLMADRYGRRVPLMIDLVFYSIIEILTGLAPNYMSFLVLRALFGIGMGGEWGVGASLAMEKVPPRLRGILSGLLQEGYACGNFLAAACALFVLPRWGWRPLFFIGGLPALLAIFIRYHVKESEVWERTRTRDWGQLRKAITSNWKIFVYLTILMAGMNLASHGTQDLYPTFLRYQWGFNSRLISEMVMISMVGAIIGGITVGYISDHFGRRRSIVGALIGGMLIVPLWAFPSSVLMLTIGAFAIQFMVQGAWGVIPAHISELSPDSIRGFLPGFAYQCGVLISAAVPTIEAIAAKYFGYASAMALTGVIVFALAAIVAALGRERKGIVFGS